MNRLIVIAAILLCFACTQKKQKAAYFKITGKAQGSFYLVNYENSVGRDLSKELDSLLNVIDNSLSAYNPESVISKINKNDSTVQMDALLKDVLLMSIQIWKESNGYFDLTVGPLVKAWGFGPEADKGKSKKIDTLMKYVGMNMIAIHGNKIVKKYPQMIVDVNAIAQGYSVDYICNYLDSLEIENYIVEIGGEVRAKGKNPKNENWKVGIDRPVDGSNVPGQEIQTIIPVSDLAVATSGNYRKFYIENGIKYSHTIDPFTGYPAKNTLLSVTIVHPQCAMADAYATACMSMGLEKAIAFIEKHKLQAYLVFSGNDGSYKEFVTPGLQKLIFK